MQHEVHLGIDFWWILIDFRSQVGVENRPEIDAKRCRKNDERKGNKMTKKSLQVEFRRGGFPFRGDRSGPGPPREGDLGGGMDYGLEALYLARQWAKGPANFYIYIYIYIYIERERETI